MNIIIMSYGNVPEERVTNREAIKKALGGNAFIYAGTSPITTHNFIDDIESVEEETDGEE